MLDIKLIRTETEKVKKALSRRKEVVDIDGLLELDNKRRELLFDVEQKKARQNAVSKEIPSSASRHQAGMRRWNGNLQAFLPDIRIVKRISSSMG